MINRLHGPEYVASRRQVCQTRYSSPKTFLLTAFYCATLACYCQGAVIWESATLGPTGQQGGNVIGNNQYLGSRFSVATTHTVTGIGGHLWVNPPSDRTVWGAIIPLPSGFTALPTFAPTDVESHALASTTFTTSPSGSVDVLESVNVVLAPGDYALVFGGGSLFGTTGFGIMANNNVDALPFGNRTFTGMGGSWFPWTAPGTRFVVEGYEGTAVPEPGTVVLWLLVAAAAISIQLAPLDWNERRWGFARQ